MKTRNVVSAGLLLALVAASGVAADKIPVPAKLPSIAWNSPWVFRAEVFVGCFIGVYVLSVICLSTVIRGRPPKKLSFGLLSFEEADFGKAVEALSEGGTALQAVETELGATQQTLDKLLHASRDALASLIDAVSNNDDAPQDALERARAALEELPASTVAPAESRREFDRAMARFEQILGQLEDAQRAEAVA